MRVGDDRELQVIAEYLFVFPESSAPDRKQGGYHGVYAKQNKTWRLILKREFGYDAEFTPEVPQGTAKPRTAKVGLSANMLAMPRVLFESEHEYPAARWLYALLTTNSVFLEPNWSSMRLASPPGQPKVISADGRNIPWLALDLKYENAPSDAPANYCSERYTDWLAHVRTALPQIESIDVREREDDHHSYFIVRYRGGFEVPSSGLSDGTLRILTLTLLPYLAKTACSTRHRRAGEWHPPARHRSSLAITFVDLRQSGLGVIAFANSSCSREIRSASVRTVDGQTVVSRLSLALNIPAYKNGEAALTLAACSQRGY